MTTLANNTYRKLKANLIDYLNETVSEKYPIDVTLKSRYCALPLNNLPEQMGFDEVD
ncbi:hypothetical protein Tco_1190861, partial [Tanacetum coccineum]